MWYWVGMFEKGGEGADIVRPGMEPGGKGAVDQRVERLAPLLGGEAHLAGDLGVVGRVALVPEMLPDEAVDSVEIEGVAHGTPPGGLREFIGRDRRQRRSRFYLSPGL